MKRFGATIDYTLAADDRSAIMAWGCKEAISRGCEGVKAATHLENANGSDECIN